MDEAANAGNKEDEHNGEGIKPETEIRLNSGKRHPCVEGRCLCPIRGRTAHHLNEEGKAAGEGSKAQHDG